MPITPLLTRTRCPVCHEAVYSKGGIHPQCAVKQSDPPRPKVKPGDGPAEPATSDAGGRPLRRAPRERSGCPIPGSFAKGSSVASHIGPRPVPQAEPLHAHGHRIGGHEAQERPPAP